MAGFSATNSRNLGNGSVRGASGTSNDSPTSVISNASSSRKRGQPASGTSPREEPSLEPENRRKSKKISRACDFCKAKKLKCSGTLPCDGCTKRQLSCVYDATYRRGRPPTPQPRPEAAPREPGSLPEAIERLISRNSEPTHSSLHGSREVSVMEPDLLGLESSTTIQGNGDGDVSTSRASPELESAEIEGQYLDPTSSVTFLHRTWKRLSSQKDSSISRQAQQASPCPRLGDAPPMKEAYSQKTTAKNVSWRSVTGGF
ncbi:ABC-transporter-regulating transcription factor like protein [Verticillium longisporum]|nr:ABC-transporter-regulating transcription factor like protein [Verticillium longisporum]